jgi:ArsR family transcriptional regulator, arsenate/arsenite/antimonite-responsive transcriptional repressor
MISGSDDMGMTADECCDVAPPPAKAATPDDRTLAMMAKALAHPARIKVLRVLNARQVCVTGDIVDQLELAQSTVSEHLRLLREAGLIRGVTDGPRTRYCIDAAGLAVLKQGVAAL